jgi:hypothetical protein
MRLSDNDIRNKISKYKTEDLVPLECDECNQIFERKKRGIHRGLNKGSARAFCGKECSKKGQNTSIKTSCAHCLKEIYKVKSEYIKSNNSFCNHSCSASFNNKGVVKNGTPRGVCLSCNKSLINLSGKKYCSAVCQKDFEMSARIASGIFSSVTAKKYLLKTRGHQCQICNLKEWNDKLIPIEMDHIDGNHKNNSLDNLRLVCPNCHAQTPTYKSKNKGNGRAKRMERYREGKSY